MTTEVYRLLMRGIADAPIGTEVICVCVISRNQHNAPYSICGAGVSKTRPRGQIQLCTMHDAEMSEMAHILSGR